MRRSWFRRPLIEQGLHVTGAAVGFSLIYIAVLIIRAIFF